MDEGRGLGVRHALDDTIGGREVQPDAAALDADQDHPGPARLAERDERRLARLAPHLPVVPQISDPASRQHRLQQIPHRRPCFPPHHRHLLRGDKLRVIHWEYTIVLSPAFLAIWSCSIIASIFALGSRSSSPQRRVAIVRWQRLFDLSRSDGLLALLK